MRSLTSTITINVLRALLVCKEQNISHGDLKPENILLNLNGQAKLNDFGESSDLHGTSRVKTAASIAYWPPEKFNLEQHRTTSLEDEEKYNVWSIGIIVFEILTGTNPILVINNCSAIEDFSLFQKAMQNSTYINSMMTNLRNRLGFYADSIGECLRPHAVRPDYQKLMSMLEFMIKNILECSVQESRDFLMKEFITYLNETSALSKQMYQEFSLNKLKFPGRETKYDFSPKNFKPVYKNTIPRLELRRYQHIQTGTYISLNLTNCNDIRKDICNLRKCEENPFVVLVYGSCLIEGIFYVCVEAMDICLLGLCKMFNPNPHDKLHTRRVLMPENVVGHISVVLLHVLNYLNDMGFIHGHINQTCVLFKRNGMIKISDFQFICKLCTKHINNWREECDECYSLCDEYSLSLLMEETHVPPERFFNEHLLDFKNDLWAFAVMLTYGVNYSPFDHVLDQPFDDDRQIRLSSQTLINIQQFYTTTFRNFTDEEIANGADVAISYYNHVQSLAMATFNNAIYIPDIYEFFAACLNIDMQKRPTVKELMEFPFYKRHSFRFIQDRKEVADYIEYLMGIDALINSEFSINNILLGEIYDNL